MRRNLCHQVMICILLPYGVAAAGPSIYWSRYSIWRSDLDGGNPVRFVDALCASSLALDRSRAELLYADDCIGGLFSVDLRTQSRRLLISVPAGTTVALAVDGRTGSIYWVDSSYSTIYRADRRELKPEALWVLRPGGAPGEEQFSGIAIAEDESAVYVTENDVPFSSRGFSYLFRGNPDLSDVEELARNTWPGTIGEAKELMNPWRDRFTGFVFVRVMEHNLHPYISGIHHSVARFNPADWSSQTIYETPRREIGLRDIAIDDLHATFYLLRGNQTSDPGSIERAWLDTCVSPADCATETVLPAQTVGDGDSLAIDPCGLDEFPGSAHVAALTACLGGADSPAARSCACDDFDEDLDVDLRDVARFQRLYLAD